MKGGMFFQRKVRDQLLKKRGRGPSRENTVHSSNSKSKCTISDYFWLFGPKDITNFLIVAGPK